MTNKELINELMGYPMDAEVVIGCKKCATDTQYSGNTKPCIKTDGNAFKTITITTNTEYNLMGNALQHIKTDDLLGEIKKRCFNR